MKTIITASIIAGLFLLHPSLNKGDTLITDLQHFVYGNELNVFANNSINRNEIEVKWLCEKNQAPCNDLIIFKNGVQVNEIPSVKGNQKLVVFYDGVLIGEITQNKNAKNQAHAYNIKLLKENNNLILKGEIVGPSALQKITIASL